MKFLTVPLLICWLLFATVQSVAAAENNKYGIHITDINEIDKAAELVNGNGGEWGYVSMTINSNDRKIDKWQERMNQLNDKRLIPIVRISTYANGSYWVLPSKDDAHDWAVFLDALHWPTKKKLVVIYNEPNHANEWGGSVDPRSYARFLDQTIAELKKVDSDFVVMNAGFDASAPQKAPVYYDQLVFMDEMEKEVPGIFNKLDAWTSHSYPNPGFSGRPTDTGRGTIRTYEWELDLLKNRFRVTKDLPVYITETGWMIRNDDHKDLSVTEETALEYYKHAFQNVWLKDQRVQAVSPFLLSYLDPQFSQFSWLKKDATPTSFNTFIKDMGKTKGQPERQNNAAMFKVEVPEVLTENTDVIGSIQIENIGNTIWQGSEFELNAEDPNQIISLANFKLPESLQLKPGNKYTYKFSLTAPKEQKAASLSFQMKQADTLFGEKLIVPFIVSLEPRLSLDLTDPSKESELKNYSITFERDLKQEIVTVNSGQVGRVLDNYQNQIFAVSVPMQIRIDVPERDPIIRNVILSEGDNTISIELPPKLQWWQKLMRSIRSRF